MSILTLAKLSFSRNDNIRYKMSNVNGTAVSHLLLFLLKSERLTPFLNPFNENSVNCLNDRGRLVDDCDFSTFLASWNPIIQLSCCELLVETSFSMNLSPPIIFGFEKPPHHITTHPSLNIFLLDE